MNMEYCDCIRFKEKDVEADHLREKLKEAEKEIIRLQELARANMYFKAGLTGSRFSAPDSCTVGGI